MRHLTYRARALRRQATPAEAILWQQLRHRRLAGAKFRRQQPLGPFIVDFWCPEAALVIEADGAHHYPPPPQQLVRDTVLRQSGVLVLRFPNAEILNHLDRVLARIHRAVLARRTPLPWGSGSYTSFSRFPVVRDPLEPWE